MRMAALLGAMGAFLLLAGPGHGGTVEDEAIARSQAAVGRAVAGFTFTTSEGKRLAIEELRGKPLLVTLIYTSCADVCPAVIESLAAAADAADGELGADSYRVLTVGFDTANDTPDRMRSFARARGVDKANWVFAAAAPGEIDRFAAAVGFSYFASAGGFNHPAQVTLIDRDGRVFDQVYGGSFDPPTLIEPLKRLIFGGGRPLFSLAGLGDRIKLFCTVYDPRTGRYYFDYSLFVTIVIGVLCLAGAFWFLVRETRKSFRGGSA